MINKTGAYYFHPAGWPFIAIFIGVSFFMSFVGGWALFASLILTVWCFYFFRNPDRVTPARSGLVISPADGRVIAIQDVVPEADFGLGEAPRTRVSIFLNVFDVHVNRSPVDGTIVSRRYRPGKFVNASLDKASVDNERMVLTLKLAEGQPHAGENVAVAQIAGLVARRIVCDVQEGQQLKAGERFGIIRFGSRTDIYLPVGVAPLVSIGQRAICGETVIADFASSEAARIGEARK